MFSCLCFCMQMFIKKTNVFAWVFVQICLFKRQNYRSGKEMAGAAMCGTGHSPEPEASPRSASHALGPSSASNGRPRPSSGPLTRRPGTCTAASPALLSPQSPGGLCISVEMLFSHFLCQIVHSSFPFPILDFIYVQVAYLLNQCITSKKAFHIYHWFSKSIPGCPSTIGSMSCLPYFHICSVYLSNAVFP